ncbi:hypothetical protein AVEN_143479-1 [Araneus ventricosus]|uniref:Peptidase M12A domain-containing protein n=1 Tax=Araneus ventricosus TaxID=182803 RepID=A0A4Y2J1J7_ARAVE|nr:hypothetical protein AVEN_143479-1 [Araneus ventricosus]
MIPPAPFSQNFRSTPEEGCMALNGFNMHQAHMHDRWGPMESNLEEKTVLLGLSQYGIYRYWIVCGCIYYSKSMPKMDSVRGIKGGGEDAFEYEANIANRQFSESFPVYKWTTRRVPYMISKEMSSNMTSSILEAIKSWNEDFGNCIKWIPRKMQKDYVYFTNGSLIHLMKSSNTNGASAALIVALTSFATRYIPEAAGDLYTVPFKVPHRKKQNKREEHDAGPRHPSPSMPRLLVEILLTCPTQKTC